MNILQLAGMLPRDPQFREWCSTFAPEGDLTIDETAEFIRVVCGVDSRRELERNADAAEAFHNLIRRPFMAWREQQAKTHIRVMERNQSLGSAA